MIEDYVIICNNMSICIIYIYIYIIISLAAQCSISCSWAVNSDTGSPVNNVNIYIYIYIYNLVIYIGRNCKMFFHVIAICGQNCIPPSMFAGSAAPKRSTGEVRRPSGLGQH